jgi:transposase
MLEATMMGRRVFVEPLFYTFRLEDHVPADHMLRLVDDLLDTKFVRQIMAPHYSVIGRPSIDPELMVRMLLIGYLNGIRSERRLCDEVHLNLAYRWFCRLGLDGAVPNHSTFSKNRHGRFRESDLFRQVFEHIVRGCAQAGLVSGGTFAIDASVIEADASRGRKADGKLTSWPERRPSPDRCGSILPHLTRLRRLTPTLLRPSKMSRQGTRRRRRR